MPPSKSTSYSLYTIFLPISTILIQSLTLAFGFHFVHRKLPHFKSNSAVITVSLLPITDDDPRILKLDDEFDVDEEA